MNPSIFLVEDDEEDRFILSLAFSKIGLRECVTFFPGSNALIRKLQRLTTQNYPSLIGMDCHLPRYSGLETLILLKNHSQLYEIPVVLFSHNITPFLRQKAMSLGALECLEKNSFNDDYTKLPEKLLSLTTRKNQSFEAIHS
jgi:CheY-like chemotaxis protein